MSWFKFINFLKFQWKSKNEYTLHSPWMFETYLQCIKGKKDEEIIKELSKRFSVREYHNEILTSEQHFSEICYIKNIYNSPQTLQFWNAITKRSDISLDINLFSIGLIVCKKDLKRQSYMLKR